MGPVIVILRINDDGSTSWHDVAYGYDECTPRSHDGTRWIVNTSIYESTYDDGGLDAFANQI